MKTKKTIRVNLLPKDFIGNRYTDSRDCPLARACNRKFKTNTANVNMFYVSINGKVYNYSKTAYFNVYIHDAIKSKYPKHDTIYYVELIPKF